MSASVRHEGDSGRRSPMSSVHAAKPPGSGQGTGSPNQRRRNEGPRATLPRTPESSRGNRRVGQVRIAPWWNDALSRLTDSSSATQTGDARGGRTRSALPPGCVRWSAWLGRPPTEGLWNAGTNDGPPAGERRARPPGRHDRSGGLAVKKDVVTEQPEREPTGAGSQLEEARPRQRRKREHDCHRPTPRHRIAGLTSSRRTKVAEQDERCSSSPIRQHGEEENTKLCQKRARNSNTIFRA